MFRLSTVLAAMLAIFTTAPALSAQRNPQVGYKEPGTATLVSVLVPGGGQLYAGDVDRGVKLLAIGVGSATVGTVLAAGSGNVLPMAAGYLVYLGAWGYGIADAGASARRMNSRHGFTAATAALREASPLVTRADGGGTKVGLQFRL